MTPVTQKPTGLALVRVGLVTFLATLGVLWVAGASLWTVWYLWSRYGWGFVVGAVLGASGLVFVWALVTAAKRADEAAAELAARQAAARREAEYAMRHRINAQQLRRRFRRAVDYGDLSA